jgi:plasmid stabilization system protein ParE
MRIRWTPPAAADMQGIGDYLKEDHPQYREATMRKLYDRICAPAQFCTAFLSGSASHAYVAILIPDQP